MLTEDQKRASGAWSRVLTDKTQKIAEELGSEKYEQFLVALFSGPLEERLRREDPGNSMLALLDDYRRRQEMGFE